MRRRAIQKIRPGFHTGKLKIGRWGEINCESPNSRKNSQRTMEILPLMPGAQLQPGTCRQPDLSTARIKNLKLKSVDENFSTQPTNSQAPLRFGAQKFVFREHGTPSEIASRVGKKSLWFKSRRIFEMSTMRNFNIFLPPHGLGKVG